MPHALDQNRDLGVEALVLRVHVQEFGQQPLHDVMLFETLEYIVGDGVVHALDERVEDRLFDGRMHSQLVDDLLDQLGLGLVCTITGLLELLEELLDGSVVVL